MTPVNELRALSAIVASNRAPVAEEQAAEKVSRPPSRALNQAANQLPDIIKVVSDLAAPYGLQIDSLVGAITRCSPMPEWLKPATIRVSH